MPYHIRKAGSKYLIVRNEDKKVVGRSDSRAKAERSIGYRMDAEAKNPKKYQRGFNNNLRDKKLSKKTVLYGQTDFKNRTVIINKKAHKTHRGKDSIISTIAHEEIHIKHPRMHEKTVRKLEQKSVQRMSRKQKQKKYNQYSKPVKVL